MASASGAGRGGSRFPDLRWTGTERPHAVVDYFASEGVTLSDTAALDGEIAQAGWRVIGARWVGRGRMGRLLRAARSAIGQ